VVRISICHITINRRTSHDAEEKETNNGEFLLEAQAEFEHRHYGKNQNGDVQQEMGGNSAKKELVAVDIADRIRDSFVPDCTRRNATEDQHESP